MLCAWALGCVMSLVAHPAQAQSTSKPDPLQAANACLERGDDACVVRALEGRARSAQELALLIETYRKLGQQERALRVMRTYVERFANGPRAGAYRALLKTSRAVQRATDKGPGRTGPASQPTPMDKATECLAEGDNACIVRVLEGKAQSAPELGLLCETYVVLGDQAHARELMREYVARFPNAPRSAHYRNALAHGP